VKTGDIGRLARRAAQDAIAATTRAAARCAGSDSSGTSQQRNIALSPPPCPTFMLSIVDNNIALLG